MNLLWFHLMPYTDLPEDFREKHPSVWVDIDSRLFDPVRATHSTTTSSTSSSMRPTSASTACA